MLCSRFSLVIYFLYRFLNLENINKVLGRQNAYPLNFNPEKLYVKLKYFLKEIQPASHSPMIVLDIVIKLREKNSQEIWRW